MNLVPIVAGGALMAALSALPSCHHAASPASQQQAAGTKAQLHLNKAESASADRAARRSAQSQAATDEATDAISHVPTAADPLDPALRGAICSGIERVRAQGDAAPGNAAGDSPCQVPQPVPAS